MKSVTILINKNDIQSLKQFCELNQMKKRKNSFYNDDFKIIYTITNSNSQAVIKEITFELIESQLQQTIQLSNLVTLEVDGTKGRFIFNK
jgi:hypothetical protein